MAAALATAMVQAEPAVDAKAPVADWIHRTARPFETCEPRDDDRDLAALRPIVRDARVVALGEGTVGTREFVQLKHRIVAYLVRNMGFTTVAIAANMPETRALNDYVQTGNGDPRALISALKYWPLDTEEMLAFVEWMRGYNASHPGGLQLVGLDMMKPDASADVVRQFLRRVDPEWGDSLEAVSRAITRARQSRATNVWVHRDFPTADAAGHHLRLTGWIRTEGVSGFAGLLCGAYAQGGLVAFDNMERQQVSGTRGWQHYALEVDVPAHADHVEFGALLAGTGKAWFDSLGIEIDGRPWTGPPGLDLALDSVGQPAGFSLDPGPAYDARMDDSIAVVGRRSLRLSSVEGYVPPDPGQLWVEAESCAARLVHHIESEGPRYRRASSDEATAWASRNAHLLVQRARSSQWEGARDSSLAANLEWVMGRLPKRSRIVLWAHNADVARAQGALGDRLARHLGSDMVVIGFATNEGRCTTTRTTSANLEATVIQPGPEGSFEALARASGVPRFLLDLRRADPGSRVGAQLQGGLTLRSIGPGTPTQQFWPTALAREYDVIAWVEKTQPTRALKKG